LVNNIICKALLHNILVEKGGFYHHVTRLSHFLRKES